jgi:hypothetical protein
MVQALDLWVTRGKNTTIDSRLRETVGGFFDWGSVGALMWLTDHRRDIFGL